MSGYLLDTNVLSEILKKRPSESVLERLRSIRREILFTSAVCVMELRFGVLRVSRGESLWRRITADVLPSVEVLPIGLEESVRAAEILATLTAAGTPIGLEDVLISATALEHGLVVSTRNMRHFNRVPGLRIESWWSETSK